MEFILRSRIQPGFAAGFHFIVQPLTRGDTDSM